MKIDLERYSHSIIKGMTMSCINLKCMHKIIYIMYGALTSHYDILLQFAETNFIVTEFKCFK